MPSTLPKCSKDTSVKFNDMSIATPKKVTTSWKPVKIWRKHHLYHPGNTFLFFGGVLYIMSVYFTWYIFLYRAKPPKKTSPLLAQFRIFAGYPYSKHQKHSKTTSPKGLPLRRFTTWMFQTAYLPIDSSPAMDVMNMSTNQPKSSINPHG